MAYRTISAEQVAKARDLLLAGGKLRAVAREIGVATDTICRWWSISPPVEAPGVPLGIPMAISLVRAKQRAATDADLTDAESLMAVRLAAKELLRVTDEFL